MKNIVLIAVLILSGCATQESLTDTTSTDNLQPYAENITPGFLRQHLEKIASDEFEGRATGREGQKKAAEYLAGFYEEIGFTPMGDEDTYFQKFGLNAEFTDSLVYRTYRVDGDTVLTDHSVESGNSTGEFVRMFGGNIPLESRVVFAGFGVNDPDRSVSNLGGTDLQDKWVMIFEDIPYIVDGDTLVNPDITSNSRIGTILGNHDAQGILIISDYTQQEYREIAAMASNLMGNPANMRLAYLDDSSTPSGVPKGILQVSPAMASSLLGLDNEQELMDYKNFLTESIQDFRAEETPYYLDYQPYDGPGTIETENVLAYLEGADPELNDEVLVLMAHYDHIGITQPDESGDAINNGADDDGSGTTALMAIAHALHQAQQDGYKPRRSILFLHVSAEEVGLLGSRYYSDHPVIPIENTVANFNADMIGRSDPENIERGDTDYVYLIGGEIISSELDSLVHSANDKSVEMRLDYGYNDLQDPNQFYRRSDHWNFGRLGVPFVFFFTGVHEDYHSPSDEVDKIDFEKLSRVARLIYTSTLEVANYDGRPEVDNQMFIEITGQQPR
ncbi:MAG: M20/M25/M40 family metallo-hydrolase [Balneolaceae bacterium]